MRDTINVRKVIMENNKFLRKMSRIEHWLKVRLFGLKEASKLFDNPEKLERAYKEAEYHEQLVKESVKVLNGSKSIECPNQYVGDIPDDWEDRINEKIAQKNKEAEHADD